jgi:hypothetical protein
LLTACVSAADNSAPCSVTDKEALAATSDLRIRIKGDAAAKTLTIEGALAARRGARTRPGGGFRRR